MTWREQIIQNIKDCGQFLMENAEEITGNIHYQKGIIITCHVDERDDAPYVSVDASFYPEKFIERMENKL